MWSLLLLAAIVRSFPHMPLGISDRNTTKLCCKKQCSWKKEKKANKQIVVSERRSGPRFSGIASKTRANQQAVPNHSGQWEQSNAYRKKLRWVSFPVPAHLCRLRPLLIHMVSAHLPWPSVRKTQVRSKEWSTWSSTNCQIAQLIASLTRISWLSQLCPTEILHWAKNYVTLLFSRIE